MCKHNSFRTFLNANRYFLLRQVEEDALVVIRLDYDEGDDTWSVGTITKTFKNYSPQENWDECINIVINVHNNLDLETKTLFEDVYGFSAKSFTRYLNQEMCMLCDHTHEDISETLELGVGDDSGFDVVEYDD